MKKIALSLILSLVSVFAHAEAVAKESVPAEITDKIYKKHPKAADFSFEKRQHFNQELLKISYKEGEEKFVDYFRPDGHYYVAGYLIAADDMMFTERKEKLKGIFNDYKIRNAIMVVNPNGTGEEFDLILENGGKNWNVVIDKKGNLEKTELN